jgi:hypothetical protein
MNMLAIFFFGREVEDIIGRAEFFRFYVAAIVAAGLAWLTSAQLFTPLQAGSLSLVGAPAHVKLGAASAAVTITDDDSVSLAIADQTFSEADGTVNAGVVTLTGTSDRAVSVSYATLAGTAVAGRDFAAASGTLTFAAGEASGATKTGLVVILNDNVAEQTETFQVSISGATGGATVAAAGGLAAVTITDDDVPTITLLPTARLESAGATDAVQASLSGPSDRDVTVVATLTAGSALAGSDYVAAGPFTLFWAAGTSGPRSAVVTIVDDAVREGTETFSVALSGATGGATAAAGSASVTVTDDDAALVFAQSVAATEGPASTVNLMIVIAD